MICKIVVRYVQENGHITCVYKIHARILQVFPSKSMQGSSILAGMATRRLSRLKTKLITGFSDLLEETTVRESPGSKFDSSGHRPGSRVTGGDVMLCIL